MSAFIMITRPDEKPNRLRKDRIVAYGEAYDRAKIGAGAESFILIEEGETVHEYDCTEEVSTLDSLMGVTSPGGALPVGWTRDKPDGTGTFLIRCDEWKYRYRVVEVFAEGETLKVRNVQPPQYGGLNDGFQDVTLKGMNSQAKRDVLWQRLE